MTNAKNDSFSRVSVRELGPDNNTGSWDAVAVRMCSKSVCVCVCVCVFVCVLVLKLYELDYKLVSILSAYSTS